MKFLLLSDILEDKRNKFFINFNKLLNFILKIYN